MDPYLEIQHFVHPDHPLILIDLKDSKTRGLVEAHKKINREKQRSESVESAEYADDVSILCVLCGNEMLDTSYSCIDCDIHLHKVCAKLPTEMMHPIHPQHPLTLADRHIRFRCDICSKELGNGFGYYCRSCDFDVDMKCAKLPTEMMHPSHPQHPLTLTDQRSYRDFECDFCSKLGGNGFSYHCRSCKFDVDVKCAKSPTEMMHPSHPQHPLTLTGRQRSFRCDICSKELGNGFSYYCRSCDFDVDVKCASRGEAIRHKGHPHQLYPFLKTVLSRCDACGTEHSAAAGGVSYMCNTCDFWIHEDCATLPATVKYHHHVHPLSLVVYTPSDNPFWAECSICEEKFLKQQKQWIYECGSGCRHKVHTICLAKTLIAERNKTYEVDVDIDLTKLFRLPESFQYDDLVAKIIKHMTIHYGGENTALCKVEGPLISHFSHKHPLTLIHNDMPSIKRKEDVLCNACVLPVSSPQAYYSCTECNNYAIHDWCAKLPNELLQHPAHPHPLILHGPDHENYGVTECPTCVFHSNGFSYRCRRPESLLCQRFAMDIKCLLPPAILHKTHKHPLKLVENCLKEGCVACPNQSRALAYGCVSCCFYLHNACALKPITIMHRYDKHHPFTSTSVEPIENRSDDDKYVCELCEEDIDPKWWFHHCLDCDSSACSECIFPKHAIAILALASTLQVHASDPSQLQDFCVAVNDPNLFVNGKFCQDPKLAKAEDFFFSGLLTPRNTSNPVGSTVTPVNVVQIPGLNTLGISMVRIDYGPNGLNPPHTHPRATEILVVLEGTLYVGFVTSNTDNRLFTKVLYPGDVFVFPEGLIHFQFNQGYTNAVAIAALSSQNPGVITVANAVFGSTPKISDDVLAKAFQVDKKVVDYLQEQFWYPNN